MVNASKRVWQAIEKKTELRTSIIASRPRTDTLLGALKKKVCISRSIIAISNNKYLGEKTIALSRYPSNLTGCMYPHHMWLQKNKK
jgi:hypothetical protein